MTDDDRFFERLRGDAAPLRYHADDATLARIRARILERLAKPSVAEVLAAWFRPLAAALTAVAIAGAISLTAIGNDGSAIEEQDVAIELAGDTYIVGD